MTDREAIERLLDDAASAAGRGDWDAVGSAFADDFRSQSERQDKAAFLAGARATWRPFEGATLRVDLREVSVVGDVAAAQVRVTSSAFPGRPVDARIECTRAPDGWRISRLVEHALGSLAR